MRWPLRNQILWPLLAVAMLSLAAVGAIHGRLASSRVQQRIESQLRGVVDVLITSNFPLSTPVLQKMKALSSAEFVLADRAGRPIAATVDLARESLPSATPLVRPEDVSLGQTASLGGRAFFHAAVELTDRTGDRDGRVLHILFPQDEYPAAWRQAFLPPLLVSIAAIGAGAIVARLLAGRISRATSRLGREVMRLATGDFSPVELPALDDELRELAVAVNRTALMLVSYEQQVRRAEQMQTMTRLGASLVHEVRNAATGCRMAIDFHAEECHGAADDESLLVARRQLRLMETQLTRFLRVGRQAATPVRRELELARLVDDLLPLVRSAAVHAKATLDWYDGDQGLAVLGDEDELSQVLLNLLLNAIEAVQQQPLDSTHARRVVVELRSDEDKGAILRVSDSGPGPSEATASSMFEPFITNKLEGAGLGLAAARQIVEAHGGTLSWSRGLEMTTFQVVLPLAEKGALACHES